MREHGLYKGHPQKANSLEAPTRHPSTFDSGPHGTVTFSENAVDVEQAIPPITLTEGDTQHAASMAFSSCSRLSNEFLEVEARNRHSSTGSNSTNQTYPTQPVLPLYTESKQKTESKFSRWARTSSQKMGQWVSRIPSVSTLDPTAGEVQTNQVPNVDKAPMVSKTWT
eukprot:Filipodium_phascolosomae@DN1009_c0_g1_i1.p1